MTEYADLQIRILKREGKRDNLSFPIERALDARQQVTRGRLDPYAFAEDIRAGEQKLFRLPAFIANRVMR